MRDDGDPISRGPAAAFASDSGRFPASRSRLLWVVWAAWCAVQAVRVLAEGTRGVASDPGSAVVGPYPIDIDRARLAELRLLPGIGPERAGAVILERVRGGPFGSVDAMRRVPGLGEVTVQGLRGWVRAGPSADGPAAGGR